MNEHIKSIIIGLFSSLWLLAFHSAGLKCLLVVRHRFEPTQMTQEHFVGWLEAARRDVNIGIICLLAVVFFWAFRLSRAGNQNRPEPAIR
jgi:hypothetical protein